MNNDNHSNLPELSEQSLASEPLRESLSALIDGELSASEAAFLIKRMTHDTELNSQWQRFQGIGEVLRGQAQVLESDSFSARVLSKIAADSASTTRQSPLEQSMPLSNRFNRYTLSRFGTGIAIAAAVAWAALLLPQRYQAELEPPQIAQTAAPLTLASPVVSMRTVSGHIGGEVMPGSVQNTALLAQSMDSFLLEHVQRSPISPISDAVYLQNVALNSTSEMNLAPQ